MVMQAELSHRDNLQEVVRGAAVAARVRRHVVRMLMLADVEGAVAPRIERLEGLAVTVSEAADAGDLEEFSRRFRAYKYEQERVRLATKAAADNVVDVALPLPAGADRDLLVAAQQAGELEREVARIGPSRSVRRRLGRSCAR